MARHIYKSLLSVFIFLYYSLALYSQAPGWQSVKSIIYPQTAGIKGYAVDFSGNSYVTGSFEGQATFGNIKLNSAGGSDIFVAKYDNNGSVQWAVSEGGSGMDAGNAITFDADGNVYVTGTVRNNVHFDVAGGMTGDDDSDKFFIAKFGSLGKIIWVRFANGLGAKAGYGISIDNFENLYVTGSFKDSSYFDADTVGSAGNSDIFIAKYNANGDIQWVSTAGGDGDDKGLAIYADSAGNSFITGYFSDTANFGGNNFRAIGKHDGYVAAYNSSGVLQWMAQLAGTEVVIGKTIRVDKAENVYAGGEFNGEIKLDSSIRTTAGGYDVFVAKLNKAAKGQWIKTGGGKDDDSINAMALDDSANIYFTGGFNDKFNLGSLSVSSADYNVYVAKLNSSGNAGLLLEAGGAGTDIGRGIGIDYNDIIYVSGSAVNNAKFDTITLQTISGSTASFIGKIVSCSAISASFTEKNDTLFAAKTGPFYQWYLDSVAIPFANVYIYTPSRTGYYAVKVTDFKGCSGLSGYKYIKLPDTLKGTILSGKGIVLDTARVFLFTIRQSDSTIQDLDSTKTDMYGRYVFFPKQSPVMIRVTPDKGANPRSMIGYNGSAFVSQSAPPIVINKGTTVENFHVFDTGMVFEPGLIGGFIHTPDSMPVANLRIVCVYKGLPVRETFTEANGYFFFTYLEYDSFNVFVDKPFVDNSVAPLLGIDYYHHALDSQKFILHPTYLEYDTTSTKDTGTTIGIKSYSGSQVYFLVSPNPFNSSLNISAQLATGGHIAIELYNMTGNMVRQQDYESITGKNNFEMTGMDNLAPGAYLLKVNGGSFVLRKVLIKE